MITENNSLEQALKECSESILAFIKVIIQETVNETTNKISEKPKPLPNIGLIEKENYPSMLKIPEVAKLLRITKANAYALSKQDGFPLLKLSEKRTRVPRDLLFEWLRKEGEKPR